MEQVKRRHYRRHMVQQNHRTWQPRDSSHRRKRPNLRQNNQRLTPPISRTISAHVYFFNTSIMHHYQCTIEPGPWPRSLSIGGAWRRGAKPGGNTQTTDGDLNTTEWFEHVTREDPFGSQGSRPPPGGGRRTKSEGVD